MVEYLNIPPAPEHRVSTLYVWIATQKNGAEGIASADMDVEGIGLRHMPLLSSKRHVAERMGSLARQIEQWSISSGDPVTIEMVEYRRRDT